MLCCIRIDSCALAALGLGFLPPPGDRFRAITSRLIYAMHLCDRSIARGRQQGVYVGKFMEVGAMAEIDLACDLLTGVPAIAAFLGYTERKTYHLLEGGKLPGFKMPAGKIWHARKSTLNKHYQRLEETAA
jgi:hypothetical protein